MRRAFACPAVWLAVLVAAAAAPNDPVTLRLWNIPDTSSPSTDAKAALRVLDEFRGQHPNVEFRKTAGISIPQIGGSAPLLMSIAGGLAPDILECTQEDLANFVEQGFLVPLDDFVKDIPREVLLDRAPQQVWDAARIVGPDGQRHLYALPSGYTVTTLKVRRDLAAKLGFPESRLPQTWDELYAFAKEVTDPAEGRYGVGLPKGDDLATMFSILLISAGGQVMEIRDDGKLYAAYDTEEGALALEFLWRLVQGTWERAGKPMEGVSFSDVNMWDAFKRGRYLATFSMISDRGMMRAADKDRFRLLPMPRAPNGRNVPAFTTGFIGLYAGQKDKRVRQVAFDYIWFLESNEARRLRTETYVQEEEIESANPLYLEKFGFHDALAKLPAGYLEFYKESLRQGYMPPVGQGAGQIRRDLNNPVQRVLAENLAPLGEVARLARIREILRESVAATNTRLHTPLTPKQQHLRKTVALAASVVIFTGFAWLFLVVHRAYAPKHAPNHSASTAAPRGHRIRSHRTFQVALILLPALGLVTLWEYYPLIRGTFIAFQDYRFLRESRWVGLDNFTAVLFSPFFWGAMARTCLYVAISLALGFLTPICLAILLHEIPRGKIFFRVLYYLPALTTGIVVIFLWKTFFEPGPNGYLNYLFSFVNIAPQSWLDDPSLAMLCCVLPTVWAGVGPGSLIYLAALKSIPEELFEAASIDGCGFFDKIRLVAIPYMKPLIIMNFVGVFIGTFHSSGYILVLTGGGPDRATLVASLEIFYEAYARLSFGAATAMSWILAFCLIGFTLFQVKYLSKVEFRSASST